ncbi:MAG: glycerol-3-phosphate acyltransferase [Phycisphaerae bacterium]|nr:glycerol-3-phosphate acyltransferase [Phycisphaerae bacterium]
MIYGKEIVVVLAAYVLGCISTGYYLTRLRTGKDIRRTGSGSTGARNVSRLLGKRWFAVTLALDAARGAAAAGLALFMGVDEWVVAVSVLGVVAGHIWPAQLGFRGGKGVSVLLGGLVVLNYHLLLAAAIVSGVLYFLSRRYIVSGMIGIATLPVAAAFLDFGPRGISAVVLLAAVVLFAHRSNIYGAVQEQRAKAGADFGSH